MADKDIVQRVSRNNEVTPREMKVLSLGNASGLDVSNLDDRQISALQEEHARNLVELERKANEAKVALGRTKGKLDTFSGAVRQAAQDGTSATITNVQEDELGRTEIIVGNTDTAKSGKVSLLQRGSNLPTLALLAVAVIALAAVFVLGGR